MVVCILGDSPNGNLITPPTATKTNPRANERREKKSESERDVCHKMENVRKCQFIPLYSRCGFYARIHRCHCCDSIGVAVIGNSDVQWKLINK